MYGKILNQGVSDGIKKLRSFLTKYYLPHRYQFNSIIPKNTTAFFYIQPSKLAKQSKQNKRIESHVYVWLFLTGFVLTDFVYSFLNDTKQSYRIYISYPKPAKFIDEFLQKEGVKAWIQILKGFWVKDRVQFMSFWDKVTKQLWAKQILQQQKVHDEKAEKLKKEISEANEKFPHTKKQHNEDIF